MNTDSINANESRVDIKYSQFQTKIENIRKDIGIMQDIFNSTIGNMQKMVSEENYQGVSSDVLKEDFGDFSSNFENYVKTVEDFVKLFESSGEERKAEDVGMKNDIQNRNYGTQA